MLTSVGAMKQGLREGRNDGNFTDEHVTFGYAVVDAVDAYCRSQGVSFDASSVEKKEDLVKLILLSDLAHKFFTEIIQLVDDDQVDTEFAAESITDFILKARDQEG